ncbi:RDD family protein [Mucilaginibacter lacusdianchii]|uniref:RDD family protein n=1 Tax=Mucilaginibacter lacusdianchii TaxID=2684211 RepID=UPI00131B0D3E|nr:RDD family protein [Mucilaginibacter sp. JXJ CY 39]
MQTITITTSQNIDIDYEVAGLGERILAYLIDGGIFMALYFLGVIIAVATASVAASSIGYIIAIAVYFGLYVFYDLVCEIFMNGQSLGKRVMKIKVVSLDGGQPTIGQYLLRWLFRIVDVTITSGVCALITVAVSDKSQRVGDMVAGTTLIKTNPRTKMDSIAFMPAGQTDYEPVYKEVTQLNDKEVALIHEVIHTYMQTGNTAVVYNMAARIKEHLNVQAMERMDDLQFLQTVVKDYNYISANADYNFNA